MAKDKQSGGTQAIAVATKAGITFQTHEYTHDHGATSYGLEAAEKLGVDPSYVFKTLVTNAGNELVVAIVPVENHLDLKALATAIKVKSVAMADVAAAERTTGYVTGGISPLGQKKRLKTVIDASAQSLTTMHVSGGRRGLEIELSPADLAKLTNATFATIAN